MKFEKINSSKFAAFKGSEISNLQRIVGGYRGETATDQRSPSNPGTGTDSDQVNDQGVLVGPPTADGSGVRNDGFGN
ncbi:MAG: hypothetical protein AB8G11_16550 [Saprospiraceae bacterium]